MKKTVFMIALVLAAAGTCTTGCKKKTEDKQPVTPTPDPGFSESFGATIDGAAFTANAINAADNNGLITINVTDGSRSIELLFAQNITVGSHNLPGGSFEENGTLYGITQGTINVTAHDQEADRITGTFTMTASDFVATQKQISGSFSVEY